MSTYKRASRSATRVVAPAPSVRSSAGDDAAGPPAGSPASSPTTLVTSTSTALLEPCCNGLTLSDLPKKCFWYSQSSQDGSAVQWTVKRDGDGEDAPLIMEEGDTQLSILEGDQQFSPGSMAQDFFVVDDSGETANHITFTALTSGILTIKQDGRALSGCAKPDTSALDDGTDAAGTGVRNDCFYGGPVADPNSVWWLTPGLPAGTVCSVRGKDSRFVSVVSESTTADGCMPLYERQDDATEAWERNGSVMLRQESVDDNNCLTVGYVAQDSQPMCEHSVDGPETVPAADAAEDKRGWVSRAESACYIAPDAVPAGSSPAGSGPAGSTPAGSPVVSPGGGANGDVDLALSPGAIAGIIVGVLVALAIALYFGGAFRDWNAERKAGPDAHVVSFVAKSKPKSRSQADSGSKPRPKSSRSPAAAPAFDPAAPPAAPDFAPVAPPAAPAAAPVYV